jgi:DHA1 family bicyclomycin/chloramphenicol resistance-like MFS transporter
VIFSGILVLSVGHMAAVGFLLAFLPFTITESIIRPFGMDILLNEAKKNTGTASSMINFIQTLLGSAGMIAGTLPWGNFITGLGIIILVAAMGSIGIWCWLRRWEAAMPEK